MQDVYKTHCFAFPSPLLEVRPCYFLFVMTHKVERYCRKGMREEGRENQAAVKRVVWTGNRQAFPMGWSARTEIPKLCKSDTVRFRKSGLLEVSVRIIVGSASTRIVRPWAAVTPVGFKFWTPILL